jgi:hypothetical protein
MATAPYFDNTQLCAQTDPELFFPDVTKQKILNYKETTDKAKSVCVKCHFIEPCLEYALQHDVHGVWAATGAKDRERMREKLGIEKPKSLSLLNDKLLKQKSAR